MSVSVCVFHLFTYRKHNVSVLCFVRKLFRLPVFVYRCSVVVQWTVSLLCLCVLDGPTVTICVKVSVN